MIDNDSVTLSAENSIEVEVLQSRSQIARRPSLIDAHANFDSFVEDEKEEEYEYAEDEDEDLEQLLPMPGTESGESGWYRTNPKHKGFTVAQVFNFDVTDEGQWILVQGPITLDDFDNFFEAQQHELEEATRQAHGEQEAEVRRQWQQQQEAADAADRDAAATRLQARFRGMQDRKPHTLVQTGVLVPMQGTEKGQSGWYRIGKSDSGLG